MQIQRPERKATRESNPHIYNFSAVSTVLTEYSIHEHGKKAYNYYT